MIPRLRPKTGLSDITAALTGPYDVNDFETAFARLMGQTHAIAFPYGRTAQLLLLESLGFRDREIILPAYSCVVVAHAIVLSGNRPVFIDSEPGGFNMDLDKAQAAITERTAAIIATSIHGYPVDLDRLEQLSAAHPTIVILQDCAHSFSAEWKGRPVQRAGRAAIFGLNISKLMTSIFGGMITTDDDELADKLRAVRAKHVNGAAARGLGRALYLCAATVALAPPIFALVQFITKFGLLDRFVRYYDETLIDMPADYLDQLGRAEASVGVRQCAAYPGIVRHRRHIARIYDKMLASRYPEGRPPVVDGATWSHYVLRVPDPERLVREAASRGIELGRIIDYCVPDMLAYQQISAGQGPFDETRRLNASVVNLPLWVSEKTARKIAATLGAIS